MLVSAAAILLNDSGGRKTVFSHNISFLNRNSRMCSVPSQRALKGLNTGFTAAVLRAPPETNQMTTERKERGLLQEIRSHLFRRRISARFPSLPVIGESPTVPTPIPSSNGPYPASSVVSSSQGSSGNNAPATIQDNRGTVPSTPFRSCLARPQRVPYQDWDSWQPLGDFPTFGDVVVSQDPLRQETLPLGTHLPGRMNRTNSENIFGNGRTPPFGPYLTPAETGQLPVEGEEARLRFPSTRQSRPSNGKYSGQ